MYFSLSTFLPWMAVAFLPWVLHLFLFRKARTIEFPSLYFLERCSGWSNRLKLHRFLLLLTRTSLILYFVLAMLDPQVRGVAGGAGTSGRVEDGSQGARSVVLVLDDRPAMRMKCMAQTATLFDVYRKAMLDDLGRRPLTQEVAAVTLSELSVPSGIRFGPARQAASRLRGVVPQSITPPAEELLHVALERFNVPVIFFSPFRADVREAGFRRAGPTVACEPNFTLFSVHAPASVAAGQPVQVHADVVDAMGRPADVQVRLRVDGKEAAVSASRQGRAMFLLTHLPPGVSLITAELAQAGRDGYPDDDARTAQVTVSADRTVAFSARRMPKALDAALRAFGIASDEEGPAAPSPGKVWESRRRIVVLDLQELTITAVQQAMDRGAEVMVFADALGANANSARFLTAFRWMASTDETPLQIDASALQAIGSMDASSGIPADRRGLRVIRKWNIVASASDVVTASFSDGTPAAVRRSFGRGSMTLIAFSATDPLLQSDPAFLLFVQGLLSSSASGRDLDGRPRESDRMFAEIPLRTGAGIPMGTVPPDGPVRLVGEQASITLTLGYARSMFFAQIPSPAPAAALYRVMVGSEEKGSVSLCAAPPPPLDPVSAVAERHRVIRYGPFFFWMAVLLMAVELLLLRQMCKQTEVGRAS